MIWSNQVEYAEQVAEDMATQIMAQFLLEQSRPGQV